MFDRRQAAIAALVAVVVLGGLLPALTNTYALHNDWSFLLPHGDRPWWGRFIESRTVYKVGRPLGAILLNLQGLLITDLVTMAVSRCVAALLVIGAALIMYRHLCREDVSPSMAGAVAALLALLPAPLLFTAWATNLVPGALTLVLASALHPFLDRAWPVGPPARPSPWIIAVVLAGLALMLIYPPTTLYVLVFTATRVLLGRPNCHKLAVRDIAVMGLVMVLYFVVGKAITPAEFQQAGGNYAFQISTSPAGKIALLGQIITTGLTFGFGPAISLPSAVPMLVIGATILMWVGVARSRHLPMDRGAVWSMALVVVIAIMATAPQLGAKGDITGYRLVAAFQGILALVVVLPLVHLARRYSGLAKPVIGVLWIIAIGHGGLAMITLDRVVLNCQREFVTYTDALTRQPNFDQVVVVAPRRGVQLVKPVLTGEFGILGTNPNHWQATLETAAKKVGNRRVLQGIRMNWMGGDFPYDFRAHRAIAADRRILVIDVAGQVP